jgi:hypothetical protein
MRLWTQPTDPRRTVHQRARRRRAAHDHISRREGPQCRFGGERTAPADAPHSWDVRRARTSRPAKRHHPSSASRRRGGTRIAYAGRCRYGNRKHCARIRVWSAVWTARPHPTRVGIGVCACAGRDRRRGVAPMCLALRSPSALSGAAAARSLRSQTRRSSVPSRGACDSVGAAASGWRLEAAVRPFAAAPSFPDTGLSRGVPAAAITPKPGKHLSGSRLPFSSIPTARSPRATSTRVLVSSRSRSLDLRSSSSYAAKVSNNSSRMPGSAREQERCLGSGSPGVRMRSVGLEGPAVRVRDPPRVGRS